MRTICYRVVSFMMCLLVSIGVSSDVVKGSQVIDFCTMENPFSVAADYQFTELENTRVECFLENGDSVELQFNWKLKSGSVEDFNSRVGSFDVVGTLPSESEYSLNTPLEIEIIKEGYTIQDGNSVVSGSDLASLLASASSAYVKIVSVPSNVGLSSDMFTSDIIETLDLYELGFNSLPSDLFKDMKGLRKAVLPTSMNQFEGIASSNELEVVVTHPSSDIVYKGSSGSEKAFFSVLDFDVLDKLQSFSLDCFMSNELSSSVSVSEEYSNVDTYLSYDNVHGFVLHPFHLSGTVLNTRVRFDEGFFLHDKEGIVRYYGMGKETYIDKGIGYRVDFEHVSDGIKATYSLMNHSKDPVSNVYVSIDGILNMGSVSEFYVSGFSNGIVAVGNSLGIQLSVMALTPVNSVWIGDKSQLKDNIYSNTYVNGVSSAFSMSFMIDELASNDTRSFSVIYSIKPVTDQDNSAGASKPAYGPSGWIIKDNNNKIVEKMKHFNKQYDNNYKVYYEEKGKLVTGWKQIEDHWYYFKEDHTCLYRGWIASSSDWYYMDNYSIVSDTWIATTHGRWYYQDQQGKMVRDQNIQGYYVNSYGIYWGIASKQEYIDSYIPNY